MYKKQIFRIMWCWDCHSFTQHIVNYGVMVTYKERSCVRFENYCEDCRKLASKKGIEMYANLDTIPIGDYTHLLNNDYW